MSSAFSLPRLAVKHSACHPAWFGLYRIVVADWGGELLDCVSHGFLLGFVRLNKWSDTEQRTEGSRVRRVATLRRAWRSSAGIVGTTQTGKAKEDSCLLARGFHASEQEESVTT